MAARAGTHARGRGDPGDSDPHEGAQSAVPAGKTALVTGASRGIGRAIATRLAAQGVKVVVGYVRNEDKALTVVRDIEDAGGVAVAIGADQSRVPEVARLFDEAEAALAGVSWLV